MSRAKTAEEARWIATSQSWLDRAACRWMGICGGTNWLGQTRWFQSPPAERKWPGKDKQSPNHWIDNPDKKSQQPTNLTDEERRLSEIPQYVLDYAPFVFLHPDEPYWPSDPAEHLLNTVPWFKDSALQISDQPILSNLSALNDYEGGESVCLTSNDNIQDYPPWLQSKHNIPVPYDYPIADQVQEGKGSKVEDINKIAREEGWFSVGPLRHSDRSEESPATTGASRPSSLPNSQSTHDGGYSPAPAVLVVIEKENDVRDAFWFYFNSFNLGNKVIGIRFGNHVGDWEHSMVRFHHGVPKAIFTSRHSFGSSAYSYDAVEKIGKRPVIYAARGSHAMYVTAGIQSYKLPFNMLHDMTARGPLWDPTILSLKSYTYDLTAETLRASNLNPEAPTSWFYFRGRWGDKAYDLSDKRQYRFAGEYHYSTGPNGPKFKNLGRRYVCENDKKGCAILSTLVDSSLRVSKDDKSNDVRDNTAQGTHNQLRTVERNAAENEVKYCTHLHTRMPVQVNTMENAIQSPTYDMVKDALVDEAAARTPVIRTGLGSTRLGVGIYNILHKGHL